MPAKDRDDAVDAWRTGIDTAQLLHAAALLDDVPGSVPVRLGSAKLDRCRRVRRVRGRTRRLSPVFRVRRRRRARRTTGWLRGCGDGVEQPGVDDACGGRGVIGEHREVVTVGIDRVVR